MEDAGFVECTPIQAATLPLALEGHDVAGQAQTGTGKTAAFMIAIYTLLLRRPRPPAGRTPCPRAVIIAPTRELAMQIREEAELLGKHCGLVIHAVYGGVDYGKQLARLQEGVDVLIGTPGRFIDYYKQKAFTLKHSEIFVADEADRMFDMGFIDDLRFIVRRMPPPGERVSFLYSATLSMRVMELAYEHMNDATRVAIDEDRITASNIEQHVYHVGMEQKLPLLLGLLAREGPSRALVFVNTRNGASEIAWRLQLQGYNAEALVGDLDQRKRIRLLHDFKDNKLDIMVATDVASRGLHIEAVSHVFNYDLPQDPEDYVHRVGRTARAGASGKAFSLACERYVYGLEAIEEFVGHKLPSELAGEDLLVTPAPYRRRPRPTPDGRRPAKGEREGKRPRSRERKRSSEPAAKAAPAEQTRTAEGAAGEPATKKKRKRRRRRKASPEKTG